MAVMLMLLVVVAALAIFLPSGDHARNVLGAFSRRGVPPKRGTIRAAANDDSEVPAPNASSDPSGDQVRALT